MKNPCEGCVPPRRHIGCHGQCQDYMEWTVELEKKKEYIRLAKEDETAQTDYRDQAMAQGKRLEDDEMNITEYLEKQGVKHHLRGFALLHTAIKRAEPGFSMMQLYTEVAKEHKMALGQVERNMRTAVHSTGNKITTMEFIARAVWHLHMEEEPRICSNCGQKMVQGYVIGDGEEYYCSDECLSGYYSEEEYDELCQQDRAYWTEWECVR